MSVILPVAQRGETILTLNAAPVADSELNSEWLRHLAAAMYATMSERNGVGIAAPQVYVSKRVIIVASRANPRYPNAPDMNAVVMINPEIREHPILEEWFKKIEPCVKDLQTLYGIRHDVNYRVYESWDAMKKYHVAGLSSLKKNIAGLGVTNGK